MGLTLMGYLPKVVVWRSGVSSNRLRIGHCPHAVPVYEKATAKAAKGSIYLYY